MMRALLRSVIQNATVTAADAATPVSLRLDPVLLRAAELLPLEQVDVVNVANGERFTTFVEAAAEGSGEVRVHGGEKHHVRAGDAISILSWGYLHDGQTLAHRAKLVTLDGQNRIVALLES
jgi:aspartate 1-decarboxylase